MAEYVVRNPNDLLICPYDRVHVVTAKVFTKHLLKCRRNYRGQEFATCLFNATHEMPQPELRYHMSHCPDRDLVVKAIDECTKQDILGKSGRLSGDTSVPPYNTWSWKTAQTNSDNDSWESDFGKPMIGFDPNLQPNAVFNNPMDLTGMTPLQKRQHHQRNLELYHAEQADIDQMTDRYLESLNLGSGHPPPVATSQSKTVTPPNPAFSSQSPPSPPPPMIGRGRGAILQYAAAVAHAQAQQQAAQEQKQREPCETRPYPTNFAPTRPVIPSYAGATASNNMTVLPGSRLCARFRAPCPGSEPLAHQQPPVNLPQHGPVLPSDNQNCTPAGVRPSLPKTSDTAAAAGVSLSTGSSASASLLQNNRLLVSRGVGRGATTNY